MDFGEVGERLTFELKRHFRDLNLDLIEKGELYTLQKDIAEIERMLKALIKSLENKPLNP